MLAMILWLTLGPRAAVLELLVEAAICVLFLGGGGGKRVRVMLRTFAERTLRPGRTAPTPA
jgi:hypothetical protein